MIIWAMQYGYLYGCGGEQGGTDGWKEVLHEGSDCGRIMVEV